MKIPLFDIDGTLFKTGNKISRNAFSYAVKEIYGIDASQHEINPEGMIDNQILAEVLKLHGLTEKQIGEKIESQSVAVTKYAQEHKNEMGLEILPGVKELLGKLKELNIPMGLLTGNVEGLAWAKLESTCIRDYFSFGAFGNMASIRSELVEVARQNTEKALKKPVKTEDLVIVGDTPKDIQCARDTGVQVIAVATGKYPFDELVDEKPDLLLHTLLDQEQRVIDFLSGNLRIHEGQVMQTEKK